MALTNTVFNPADSLLSFMNRTTSNIHDAMNSGKTKRKVNIRRFISKNVNKPQKKRLQAPNKPKAVAETKPPLAAPTPLSDKCQPRPAQNNPESCCNHCYHPTESQTVAIDAEVNDVLSVLGVDEPDIARENFGSQTSLGHQVMIAEYPYSPISTYSDCSEEWFDSAYSSPSCSSNAYLTPPTDVCELVLQRSPAYPAGNPVYDQGLPVTPTLFEVLDSFGWSV